MRHRYRVIPVYRDNEYRYLSGMYEPVNNLENPKRYCLADERGNRRFRENVPYDLNIPSEERWERVTWATEEETWAALPEGDHIAPTVDLYQYSIELKNGGNKSPLISLDKVELDENSRWVRIEVIDGGAIFIATSEIKTFTWDKLE